MNAEKTPNNSNKTWPDLQQIIPQLKNKQLRVSSNLQNQSVVEFILVTAINLID